METAKESEFGKDCFTIYVCTEYSTQPQLSVPGTIIGECFITYRVMKSYKIRARKDLKKLYCPSLKLD